MILEALAEKVRPMTTDKRGKKSVKRSAMKEFQRLTINEFLDENNEVFDFDNNFVPDLAW